MLKKLTLALAVLSSAVPALASEYYESVPVVSVTPRYARVDRPQERCWTETEYGGVPPQRSLAGAIIGGVAGGLLGHQVGNGNGRVVATAAGAITGAIVGNRLDNGAVGAETVQRCRTVDYTQRVPAGYQVVYAYDGQDYVTTLPYAPGATIQIPVERAAAYYRYDYDRGWHRGWRRGWREHHRRWGDDDE
ncbi:MAG: glycine zipper 2TM domain-containing protein [Betaproteobacteria bacterium]|nr:glycine zipper 2TM domain-containing protein [Betaproteobacteria bacterium]